jgi:uncharacterized protein
MQEQPAREAYGPVATHERLATLDVLRGFALLGIALMNIEFFARPLQGMMLGFDDSLVGVDRSVGWAIAAFVQGKFWTLFSLLFGMGFALMLERADALRADPGFNRIYARRLAVLLLIGLLHATLLWAGDILVPYALGGFALLLMFRNTPTAQMRVLGLVFYFVPLALMWSAAGVFALTQFDPAAGAEMAKEMGKAGTEFEAAYAQADAVYRNGSYFEVVQQRVRDTLTQYSMLPMMLPAIVGMFLLGASLLRDGVIRDPVAHRRLFRGLLWLGGPVGALLAALAMRHMEHADMILPTIALASATTAMMLGSLLLCLAYLSAIVLLLHGPLPGLERWLAPVGRMALSNYLLQSLVFSTLLFGYGFGLWGKVSRSAQVLLVLAFFVVQIALSRWWLARFRYGPMEWLWRAGTYGTRPPMRR